MGEGNKYKRDFKFKILFKTGHSCKGSPVVKSGSLWSGSQKKKMTAMNSYECILYKDLYQ